MGAKLPYAPVLRCDRIGPGADCPFLGADRAKQMLLLGSASAVVDPSRPFAKLHQVGHRWAVTRALVVCGW